MAKQKLQLGEDLKASITFIIILGIIVLFFGLFSSEAFMTTGNFKLMLKHISMTAIIALGLTFVVASGHFDMSFPDVGSWGAMSMAFMIASDVPVVLSIFIGLFAAAIFGIINGFAIAHLKLPDMVVTLGTGLIAWGISYLYSNGDYISENFLFSGILELNDAVFFTIPLPVILTISLYLTGGIILHKSRFGRCFYATGENRTAAIFSGIKTNAYVTTAFFIGSLTAGFGVIMMAASQGQGTTVLGRPFLLPVYAAVFIGIALFKRPTVIGTFFGAMITAIIRNGFSLMGLQIYSLNLILGIVLLTTLLMSSPILAHKLSLFRLIRKSDVGKI